MLRGIHYHTSVKSRWNPWDPDSAIRRWPEAKRDEYLSTWGPVTAILVHRPSAIQVRALYRYTPLVFNAALTREEFTCDPACNRKTVAIYDLGAAQIGMLRTVDDAKPTADGYLDYWERNPGNPPWVEPSWFRPDYASIILAIRAIRDMHGARLPIRWNLKYAAPTQLIGIDGEDW